LQASIDNCRKSDIPIYAYRCESCGFEKDVLQKMSDAPLSHCPECGEETFRKQVTAAGFQLKGSGWYVTDFRGGNNGKPGAKKDDGEQPAAKADGASDIGKSAESGSKSEGANASSSSADATKPGGAAAAPAPAAAAPAAPSKD
jgi:putative FmdB family regulatory protein